MYKSLTFLFLASSVLILSSCNEDLNLTPLDSPSSETFYSNQSELDLAINGVYNATFHWSISGTPWFLKLEMATDHAFDRSAGMQVVAQGGGSASTGIFRTYWVNLYRAIARANNLLDNMSRASESVSDDILLRIEAEARFLRAYAYHHLTELYGAVPLLTGVPATGSTEIGRTPKEDVVNQIIEDLDFAAQNLPLTWSGSQEGRITSGAALALKARVSLYNDKFDLAAESAKQVIDSGIYSLHPDYEEIFKLEGQRNSEVILDIPYQVGIATHNLPRRHGPRFANAWSQNVPSQFLIDSYQTIDGMHIDESPIYDKDNPFENRDPRLDASIVRPQSILGEYVFETHPDSIQTWRIEDGNRVRVHNEDATNPFASFTGYLFRKYTNPSEFGARIDDSEQNIILIRLSEMYLIYAESMIELNNVNTDVLDALNIVRSRAYGVDPSDVNGYPAITTNDQEELRHEVRYERKVELAVEGFRLFDIRRWGIAEEVMNGALIGRPSGAPSMITAPPHINKDAGHHPVYGSTQNLYRNVEQRSFNKDRDYLWAIPQDEINVNENIDQNPGY